MTDFTHRIRIAFTLCLTIMSIALSGMAVAANGNGKVKEAQPKGKAIGLVNRVNGTTIDYDSLETEEESEEEGEEDEDLEDDESGPGPGKGRSRNNGQGNASDGLMARIYTNQDIIYTGDLLEVGVHFARGAGLINDGLADAYLVIFAPPQPAEEGQNPPVTPEPIVVPLNQEVQAIAEAEEASPEENPEAGSSIDQSALNEGEEEEDEQDDEEDDKGKRRKLFEVPAVDISEIPAGTYQLGLILTVPGGDPLSLDDWFNGLLGLAHIRGLTITDEALPADADGDGMMDCEADIEGMTCEEDDNPEGKEELEAP